MAALEEVTVTTTVPLDFPYNYRVGQYLEKYIQGLGDKKILGVRCPDCGKVLVPPRKVCGTCVGLEEWVEVGQEGTVENYTVAHVKLEKGLIEKLEAPRLLAMITLDGASVPLLAEVRGIEAPDLKKGLRVRAVFKDPPEGSLSDLDHFEPV